MVGDLGDAFAALVEDRLLALRGRFLRGNPVISHVEFAQRLAEGLDHWFDVLFFFLLNDNLLRSQIHNFGLRLGNVGILCFDDGRVASLAAGSGKTQAQWKSQEPKWAERECYGESKGMHWAARPETFWWVA